MTTKARSWELTGGILEELQTACMQNPIVLARLKGFVQGAGLPESAQFRLELSARLVPLDAAAGAPAAANGSKPPHPT